MDLNFGVTSIGTRCKHAYVNNNKIRYGTPLLSPPYVIGQTIISFSYLCPVVSFFLSLFFFLLRFPRLISAVADWMSAISATWCGPSANLECRSQMYSTRLAGNAGPKKSPKNRRLGTIAQLCRAISSQLRHTSTIGKNLLSSNISSACPHSMVNVSILAAEIVSLVWGTPANFNGFHDLASLLQRRRSTEANQTLHNVWPLRGLVD